MTHSMGTKRFIAKNMGKFAINGMFSCIYGKARDQLYTLEDYKPPSAVRSSMATLPINQSKGKPPFVVCPISNVHRCIICSTISRRAALMMLQQLAVDVLDLTVSVMAISYICSSCKQLTSATRMDTRILTSSADSIIIADMMETATVINI